MAVFYATAAWMFIVFGVPIAAGYYEPSQHKVAVMLDRLAAVWLILSAATVYVLDRYREGVAQRKAQNAGGLFPVARRDDEFMFIRMSFWTYILLAFAAWALGSSFFV
ncbi:MAG: hypothetical protein WCA81_13170 [Rhizomicrobium sp.]